MSKAVNQGKVDVYCDLIRKCSSVKALTGPLKGEVIEKPTDIVLADVTMRVSSAAAQRVRETGVRCVHAFARGTPTTLTTANIRSRPDAIQVRCNPHLRDEFFDAATGQSVTRLAWLGVEGKTAWGVRV